MYIKIPDPHQACTESYYIMDPKYMWTILVNMENLNREEIRREAGHQAAVESAVVSLKIGYLHN